MEDASPGRGGDTVAADESAATLVAAVLDEEAAREDAQARSREQVIFPDELLPGVNSELVTMREAFVRGAKLMFIVLSLIVALDELEGTAIQVLEPEIRRTFHVSSGTVAFISIASSAFVVLGAVHGSLMADNYPIGIHARMAAMTNLAQQVTGIASPILVAAIAEGAAELLERDDLARAVFFGTEGG